MNYVWTTLIKPKQIVLFAGFRVLANVQTLRRTWNLELGLIISTRIYCFIFLILDENEIYLFDISMIHLGPLILHFRKPNFFHSLLYLHIV